MANFIISNRIDSNFVVIDFETTGFSSSNDKIIQVAALRFKNFQLIDRFVSYVNPEISIPYKIQTLTGISNLDVYEAPRAIDIIPELVEFINGDLLIAPNARFDASFLVDNVDRYMSTRETFEFTDTVQLAKQTFRLPNYKLETLKHHLRLTHLSSHEAKDDCLVTAEVYKYCAGLRIK